MKWTLSALLRKLEAEGHNVKVTLEKIEELVVKTLACVEPPIVKGCKRWLPHEQSNANELFGL